MDETFRYRAFISYSHRDKIWGDWLHKALESYRVPKRLVGTEGRDGAVPAKLFPIFRDREELPSSADLSEQIGTALAQAEYLIVICSPSAAQSHWVNEEILAYKRLGREDRILALIVDGEPNAADKPGGEAERECFPESLRFKLGADGHSSADPTEPIAADARPEGDGKENAKLKLIAGLLGVGFDALKQRELEAARRRTRIYQGIAGSMALLAVLAVTGGVMAYRNERRAEAMAARAVNIAGTFINSTLLITNRAGVSGIVVEGFLSDADAQLDALYKNGVDTPDIMAQRGELLVQFADYYIARGDSRRSRDSAQRASDVYAGLAARYPDNEDYAGGLAKAEQRFGNALKTEGHFEAAAAAYRREVEIGARLLKVHPANELYRYNDAVSQEDLALLLFAQGNDGDALKGLHTALALNHQLAGSEHSGAISAAWAQGAVAKDETEIGIVLNAQRNYAGALQSYRAALGIVTVLAAQDSANTDLQERIAQLHRDIGDALLSDKNIKDSLAEERLAEEQFTKLTGIDSTNVLWERELAESELAIGDALRAGGQPAAALASYKSALARTTVLAQGDPANMELKTDLASIHFGIGTVQDSKTDWHRALAASQQLLAEAQAMAAADPRNIDLKAFVVVNLGKVAGLYLDHGDVPNARAYLARAKAALAGIPQQPGVTGDPHKLRALAEILQVIETSLPK